jgi:hypothetical protein
LVALLRDICYGGAEADSLVDVKAVLANTFEQSDELISKV